MKKGLENVSIEIRCPANRKEDMSAHPHQIPSDKNFKRITRNNIIQNKNKENIYLVVMVVSDKAYRSGNNQCHYGW